MSQRYAPNDSQLIRLSAEAVKNAARKQDSAAKLLAADGDPSTAFAVAALGMEELGKSFVCSTLLSQPPQTREKASAALLSSHQAKMYYASTVIRLFVDEAELPADPDALFAQIAAAAEDTNEQKFHGLYVDAEEDGVGIRTPDATLSQARALVDMLGHAISALTAKGLTLTGEEDPAEFRSYMDHLNHNRAQAEQLIDENPLAVFDGFRAVTNGQTPPQWLIDLAPPDVAEQLQAGAGG